MNIPKLEDKGKWATIIGMIIGLPASVLMTILLWKNGDFEYIPFSIAFGFSIVFFILPSSFIVSFKDFKIEVKD